MQKPKVCIDPGNYGKYNRCPNDPSYYKREVLWKLHLLPGAFSVEVNVNAMLAKGKAAGFDAFVTMKSGSAVSGGTALKSVAEIAREVFAGKWGNGEGRKNRLTATGYDYSSVQATVNKLV